MRLLGALAILLLITTPSAGQQSASPRVDTEEVEVQWRKVIATFDDGDVDAFMALTTEDVVLMPPGGSTLSGREAARPLMEDFFGAFDIRIETLSLEEIVVAGNWALVRDTYVSRLTPKSGGDAARARGKNIWIFRRQAGGLWKVARNMWNSSDPDTNP